ncbi:hypothetical protein DAI22_11g132200 [Oryza sativa Japonica Group]|nr:hypothetical protein DAI22_11g132200 [Oryza sativa Japonica Group]
MTLAVPALADAGKGKEERKKERKEGEMGECGPHCRNRAWMEESRCTTATDEATTTRFGARGKRSSPAMHVPQPLVWSIHAPGFFFLARCTLTWATGDSYTVKTWV